jgi:hypothetical protein
MGSPRAILITIYKSITPKAKRIADFQLYDLSFILIAKGRNNKKGRYFSLVRINKTDKNINFLIDISL